MRLTNKICALTCAFILALSTFAISVRPAYAVPTQDDLDAARAQLEQLGAEMASIQENLQKAECDLEETRNRIDETNAAIADTEAELDARRILLGNRMRSSYKSGRGTIFDLLFGARDFEDLVNIIYYIDKVSESDANAIDDIITLEKQLEEQKAALEIAQQQQEAQIAETERQLAEYDEKIAEAQAYYDQLDAEIQAELARQAEEEARRQAELEAQQAAEQNGGLTNVIGAIETGDNGTQSGTDTPAGPTTTDEPTPAQYNSIVASPDVIANAYQLCGMPYKTWYSGRNYGPDADGYDCCGLVATSYQMAGYSTPYATSVSGLMSWVQGRGNWKDCNLSNYQQVLNPGDIIFCSYGHVAIYIGGEYMIHAPYPGQYVCVAWVYDCIGGGFGG